MIVALGIIGSISPMMSSGPTFQDMLFGIYSLCNPTAALCEAGLHPRPLKQWTLVSCLLLFPASSSHIPVLPKRERELKYLSNIYSLCPLSFLKSTEHWLIWNSLTVSCTNPCLANCFQPQDADWWFDSLIEVQLYNSLYSSAIKAAGEAEAFRRRLRTGCFNKSWALWCKRKKCSLFT